MSTTTVSYSSTTDDVEIEALRRREAEAREAARRAAQRAEEERRREEALSRRIAVANRAIAKQEAHFQREIALLDEATRRLPDLTLRTPTLPALTSDVAQDVGKLEAYAERLGVEVGQFSQRLGTAIAEAEHLLARRIAKAAAWRAASDLEQQRELSVQASRGAATRLGEAFSVAAAPEKPQAEAELEAVEAYVAALRQDTETLNCQYVSLHARVEGRARAATLSGAQVQTNDADEAHARYEAARMATAQAALRSHLRVALSEAQLRLEELPDSLRRLIDDAASLAHVQDQRERVARWIAREKRGRDGIHCALTLMQNAPDLVHDDAALAQRWSSLLAQLQRIAGGLEDFTPSIEREYAQLRADARRLINTAFTKADWVRAMSEQGFEVFERDDGLGLVVVDLDHPEIWLEATEYAAERGGFAAALELKTDADSLAQDERKVTSDVCAKLARAAGTTKPDVATETEVIERKNCITRGRRPAKAQKNFAQPL